MIAKTKSFFSSEESYFFDADWYRAQYDDVLGSRLTPWQHFVQFGISEGRLMSQRDIDQWFDDDLFANYVADFEQVRSKVSRHEIGYLGWLFARRHAYLGQWGKVKSALDGSGLLAHANGLSVSHQKPFGYQPAVLWLQACWELGELSADEFKIFGHVDVPELSLLSANAAISPEAWSISINALLARYGLAPIELASLSFDGLSHCNTDASQGPLVSILIPAHNAQSTIQLAIHSLMTQSYQNIEIIVIDDASSDQTAERVEQFIKEDARIALCRNATVKGPFASKNIALAQCQGDLITTHDADDWSHPQKIEKQVEFLMENPALFGCFSSWARLSNELQFGGWERPSHWSSWIHKNTSSLMVRRCVYERLGFWDEVRCNGDVEYVERIMAGFGRRSLATVLPSTPLAFGRAHPSSLTSQEETHVLTSLRGLRFDYLQSAREWHKKANSIDDLYLPQAPKVRPFPISEAMQVNA